MLCIDKERYPGGCMGGFIVWIGEKVAAFRRVSPQSFFPGGILVDHTAFDAWLRGN